MKRTFGFLAALSWVVACGGSTLTVAENNATAPDSGPTDAGTTSSKNLPDGASKCCPIDDHPGCCMHPGGTRKDASSCGEECDGMPWPNDPGWHRVTNADGCDEWQYTNTSGADPGRCGQILLSDCNPPCLSNEVCVRDQVVGGAIFLPDDAGACPPGRHLESGQCMYDPTYQCVPRPSACSSGLTCGCAGSVCSSQNGCPYSCESTTPTQVNCLCAVP